MRNLGDQLFIQHNTSELFGTRTLYEIRNKNTLEYQKKNPNRNNGDCFMVPNKFNTLIVTRDGENIVAINDANQCFKVSLDRNRTDNSAVAGIFKLSSYYDQQTNSYIAPIGQYFVLSKYPNSQYFTFALHEEVEALTLTKRKKLVDEIVLFDDTKKAHYSDLVVGDLYRYGDIFMLVTSVNKLHAIVRVWKDDALVNRLEFKLLRRVAEYSGWVASSSGVSREGTLNSLISLIMTNRLEKYGIKIDERTIYSSRYLPFNSSTIVINLTDDYICYQTKTKMDDESFNAFSEYYKLGH